MSAKKFSILGVLLLGIIVGGCRAPNDGRDAGRVVIGGKKFRVEIADTRQEKEKGLSGRESLAEDAGILFVYEKPQKPGFWMKDMLIPLDFIWINNGEVVRVDKNVQPADFQPPDSLVPEQKVDMVLEVNAGIVKRYGIEIGDRVSFKNVL
jgi:hypothetical protein